MPDEPRIVAGVGTATSAKSKLAKALGEAETLVLRGAFDRGLSVYDAEGVAQARAVARAKVRAMVAKLPPGATFNSLAELIELSGGDQVTFPNAASGGIIKWT